MATNNSINLKSQGVPYYDGSSTFTAPTLTNHAFIIAGASNAIKSTSAATNGQLLIGSTGADPVVANLTAGTGISITNSAGGITIAVSGGGFTWTEITSATQTIAVDNGYVSNRGGGVVYTLPASASLGDEFEIVQKVGTFQIAQNANQQIVVGSTSSTVGVGGSVTSTASGDAIHLVCTTSGASTVWTADFLVGNLTVV